MKAEYVAVMRNAAQEIAKLISRSDDSAGKAPAGLKACRKAAGLTQHEAANAIGVCPVSYQEWEHGRYWPSSRWMPMIAVAFGVSLEELFLGPEGEADNGKA